MIKYEVLIKNIDTLAMKRGISRTTALNESGAGKDFICNMKKGQKPALDKTVKLAEFFNVSVDYLVSGRKDISIESESTMDTNDVLSWISSCKDIEELQYLIGYASRQVQILKEHNSQS